MKLKEDMPDLTGFVTSLNVEPTTELLMGDKPTLIHFWSLSSRLFIEAIPLFNKLRDKYKEELNVIAIHIPTSDDERDIDNIKNVATEHNITQPILIDNEMKLNENFKNQYVPAYYVFDKGGKLNHLQAGGNGIKMLEKKIIQVIS